LLGRRAALIVGIGVDGGHGAAVDAKKFPVFPLFLFFLFSRSLADGREAVGGARSVGNDVVLRPGRRSCR